MERLSFRGDAGFVEVWCTADVAHQAVGVHLSEGGSAGLFRMGKESGVQPAAGYAAVDGVGQHLREVDLAEGGRVVQDIVEGAVGKLIGESRADQLPLLSPRRAI